MTRETILNQLKEVVAETLEWDGEFNERTPLVEALALDSLRMLTLLVAVEDRFEICLDETDEEGLEVVGDLVDILAIRAGASHE